MNVFESAEQEASEKNQSSPYLIPGAIVAAGLLIAGAVLYSSSPREELPPSAKTANVAQNVPSNLADDDPILGDPNAPVTMVEFGDYQCPFCKRFFETTEKEIIEKYVKTGKVKFVYRDFPLTSIHDMAQKSAEASECADEQGQFWRYHDILYKNQETMSEPNFKLWAGQLGLNQKQFDSCLDSGKYLEEVEKDFADGQAAGVNGTPASFINGRLVAGALPFAQFEQIIEQELRRAK